MMNECGRIIAEVRKYECLYNKKIPETIQYKESLWKKIGEDLDMPWAVVKKKFRNMRDTYKKSKRNKKTKRYEVRKPYRYADQLRFLDSIYDTDVRKSRLSESTLDVTTDTQSDTDYSFRIKEPKVEINEEPDDLFLQTAYNSPYQNDSENSDMSTQKIASPPLTDCDEPLQQPIKHPIDISNTPDAIKPIIIKIRTERKMDCEKPLQQPKNESIDLPNSSVTNKPIKTKIRTKRKMDTTQQLFLHTAHNSSSSNDSDNSHQSSQNIARPPMTDCDEPLEQPVKDPINVPTSSVANNHKRTKIGTKRKMNTTLQLFECLAKKVMESKLTKQQINQIELSVCKLVYSKIGELSVDSDSSY